MIGGRRPTPTAIRRANGNPGRRAWNHNEPVPPDALPRCPAFLSPVAQKEWRRLANTLHKMGVLTVVDRAALAAYCAAYGRWVEAEEKLKETPTLFKTPAGYVQQSPWLGIANKQLELMGRYMVELGITPASRSRVVTNTVCAENRPMVIERVIVDAQESAVERLTAKLNAMAERQRIEAETAT